MFIYFLIIGVWLLSGYGLARYGAKISDLILLIPASLGSGILLHVALLNVSLRVSPSGWLVLLLQMGLAGFFWWRNRARVAPLSLSVRPTEALILGVLWLSACAILFFARQSYSVLDEIDHAPRAVLTGLYGLPPQLTGRSHANPEYCAYYHYAENMAEGVLWRQTGIRELEKIADLRVLYGVAAVLGLCFNFLRRLFPTRSLWWAVLGTFLFFTLSPANWLGYLTRYEFLNEALPEARSVDYLRQVSNNFDFEMDEYAPFIHPPDLLVPLTTYIDTPNPLMFWIPAFLAWLLWLSIGDKPAAYVLMGALVGFSALYFETAMPLVAVTIGLDLLWRARRLGRFALMNLGLYTGSALLVMIFQGGTLTDTLFCPPLGEIHAQVRQVEGASLASFAWNGGLSYAGGYSETDYAPVNLLHPADWLIALVDWGVGLFLLPILWLYALYRRAWRVVLLSGVALALVLFSLMFTNQVTADNNYRFAVLPLWMGAGLSIFLWMDVKRVVLLAMILLMSLTSVVNVVWSALKPATPSLLLAPIDYRVQAEWLGRLDPLQESVFDPSLDLFQTKGTARAIVVFGTHGRHIIHVSLPEVRDPRTQIWRENLLPGDLRVLGYTHLYIDQDVELTWFQRQNLENPDYYQLLGEWQDGSQWRHFYAIVGEVRYVEGETVGAGTLGLSAANFAAYQAYIWEQAPDTVIFNPTTGMHLDPMQDILRASHALENGDLSAEAGFELLNWLTRMRYEYQIGDLSGWRADKRPAKLEGVDFLLVDGLWLSWLSEADFEQIQAYPLRQEWILPNARYYLYQVDS